MKYNNFDITKIYYSGHTITSAYGCGGYKVFDTEEPPTPPTPPVGTKLTMVNNSGNTYTIECNSNNEIIRDDWVWDYLEKYGTGGRYTVTDVVIGDCVSIIGDECFQFLEVLTSLTISRNVTTIGNDVFGNCKALQSVYIHSGITSMGIDVFANCTSLTAVTLEQGLTTIGNGAFLWCPNITSITIPSSVTNIGEDVFNYCQGLTSVRVESPTPPTLGSSAFYDTSSNLVIYVPSGSVETYKQASGWSEYSDKIVPIE